MPTVALATCAELPDLFDEEQPVVPALQARGVEVKPVVWDATDVSWGDYDLVVIRSTWDYHERRDEYVAWAHRVPRLANPATVVEWNTDKAYLRGLAEAGVPVVPTAWLAPSDPVKLPDEGQYVLKPSIGAGSRDAGRYLLDDSAQRELAQAHAERLLARGATVMVQPYLEAVDTLGETSLMYFDGKYSHAVGRSATLQGPDDGTGQYREGHVEARVPSPAERAAAEGALAAVPGGGDLLYARVDLVLGHDGAPVLMELELTEPSLFLTHNDQAPARLAEAIMARLNGAV